MNLDDFPVLGCARKVVGGAFVEEYMQCDLIKCRVPRVPVVFPVRDVHIPLYIAFDCLFAIYADSRVNEIGAGLAVPESELDDLNEAPAVVRKMGTLPEKNLTDPPRLLGFGIFPL